MVHDGVLLGERVVLELLLVVLDHAEKVVVCVVGVHLDGLLLLLHDLLLLGAPLLAVLLKPLHLLHHVRPPPVCKRKPPTSIAVNIVMIEFVSAEVKKVVEESYTRDGLKSGPRVVRIVLAKIQAKFVSNSKDKIHQT